MSVLRTVIGTTILLLLFALASPIRAQQEQVRIPQLAPKVVVQGPKAIPLAAQGSLQLPQGMTFIPSPKAYRIFRTFRREVPDLSLNILGLITPPEGKDAWLAFINFRPDGYVRDDAAKKWNADELLAELKNYFAGKNRSRHIHSFPKLEITGWIEEPTYNSMKHQLIWSTDYRKKDKSADAERVITYKAFQFGREGSFEITFIIGKAFFDAQKPTIKHLAQSPSEKFCFMTRRLRPAA